MTRNGRTLGFAVVIALTTVAASPFRQAPATVDSHFAAADDRASVIPGKQLYLGHCAGCHGRFLQGQPLWQLADSYAGRRAPAFDETGYTWQHSDEEIFHMTKYGTPAKTQPAAVSFMPAFQDVLNDRQILAIIAFIKARWPIGLRILQAMRNPGLAGMPANADAANWQLPPNCNAILRRSEAAAARPK
jgi:mono/diheme cytochrome c family protein